MRAITRLSDLSFRLLGPITVQSTVFMKWEKERPATGVGRKKMLEDIFFIFVIIVGMWINWEAVKIQTEQKKRWRDGKCDYYGNEYGDD